MRARVCGDSPALTCVQLDLHVGGAAKMLHGDRHSHAGAMRYARTTAARLPACTFFPVAGKRNSAG